MATSPPRRCAKEESTFRKTTGSTSR